jgi:hypothetical protein
MENSDTASGYTEGDSSCGDNAVYVEEADGDGNIQANFPTGLSYSDLLQSTPSGWWQLQAGGNTVAYFDLDATNPFNDKGKPNVYVPVPKATTTNTDELDTISVKWQRWDPAQSQYVDVDPASMDATVYESFVELNPSDDNKYNTETLYGTDIGEGAVIETVSNSDFSQNWHTRIGSQAVIQKVTISYEMGGVQYRFEWVRQ